MILYQYQLIFYWITTHKLGHKMESTVQITFTSSETLKIPTYK